MVKKILMLLIAVAGISAAASARDTYTHDAAVLPQEAQTVIKQNFKSPVSVVKIDKELGRVSEYEVILTDGTEITFDRNGKWDNVEVSNQSSVPDAFVPDAVAEYVRSQQPGQRITGIDKERSGYDVELSNGVEIKFNRQGQFVRYDD